MKTIVFDFDGTLTKKDQNIWKMLWQNLGYNTDKTSIYAKLYVEHVIKKTITRLQWFNLTCVAFKRKGMTKQNLIDVTKNISLIDGFKETIKTLYNLGYSLHIVSGGIRQSILSCLGEYAKYFTHIESNDIIFDENNKLKSLSPTPFDFEGKATYINNLKKLTNTKANEIIFIGNGDNDEWAYKTGCKTICINPSKTDSNNRTIWHKEILNLTNLTQILPEIIPNELNLSHKDDSLSK